MEAGSVTSQPSQRPAGEGVPLSEISPNRYDWPIEAANFYLRSALLNSPAVIDHLLDLATLRAAAAHRTRSAAPGQIGCLVGETFLPVPGLAVLSRYWRALEGSLLREQFSACQLDDLVAIVRRRLEMGCWGLSIPVNDQGAGYGRQKDRARAMTPDTIELYVSDFVRRLSGQSSPHLKRDAALSSTIRKVRQRGRRLPTL